MENFYINKRIYYHDTDCGGVVYYANYLKHLEEARTEFCLKRGIDLKDLAENDIYFVVARIEVDYKAAARYGDIVKITARLDAVKRSALVFYQEIWKDTQLLIRAKTIWVCVRGDFKPRSIPENIKALFNS